GVFALPFLLPGGGCRGEGGGSRKVQGVFRGWETAGENRAGGLPGKNAPARRDQRAADVRALERRLPFRLAGERVDRAQIAALLGVEDVRKLHAEPELARLEVDRLLGRQGFVVHAPIERIDVEQPRRRVERHW